MKLIVQIPCLNEEKTLPLVVRNIPRGIMGIDEVEILVIDDGSKDNTSKVAHDCGVDHIIRLTSTKGLARAFMVGIEESLKRGADIIVNTDGDNQYKGEDIPRLIRSILDGKADIVIGVRDIRNIKHFSWSKKRLQLLGSWAVRKIANTDVPDVTSGFRAYKREAALKVNAFFQFSYTLDTLIQAGKANLAIEYVPCDINPPLRESRLFSSLWQYVMRSIGTLLRVTAMYEGLRIFIYIGICLLVTGGWIFFAHRNISQLIGSSILMTAGLQFIIAGILMDLISTNRRILENIYQKISKLESD